MEDANPSNVINMKIINYAIRATSDCVKKCKSLNIKYTEMADDKRECLGKNIY